MCIIPVGRQIEQPYDTRTIDLSCTEKGFCPLDSGIFKISRNVRLRETPIGPDAARRQPAPLSHPFHIDHTSPLPRSHRPRSTIARRQAWPLATYRHDSESSGLQQKLVLFSLSLSRPPSPPSLASRAAARRRVGKREKGMFGSERKTRSAASRTCREIKASMVARGKQTSHRSRRVW